MSIEKSGFFLSTPAVFFVRDTVMITATKQQNEQVSKIENPPLRQHQKDALSAVSKMARKGKGRGKVVLPTGTGKTRIEAECIALFISRLIKNEQHPGIYVVLSPRIILTFQLLYEISSILGKKGIDCSYLNVNSGDLDSTSIEKELLKIGFQNPEAVESTTNKDLIKAKMITVISENKPLVIFSTYHSAHQVDSAANELDAEVSAYIYDEAQYCVTSGAFQESPNYESAFKIFLTATEKFTDDDAGLGMQNMDRFGKVLFEEKPKTLIERGEMSSVAIHLVGARGGNVEDNDYESMAKIVIDAFEKHESVIGEHSFNGSLIGPKMIVVCDKQDSLKGIMRSRTMKDYRQEHNDTTLCALSSEFGIEINGKLDPRVTNKGKECLLKKLRALASIDKAIVFHVDMISEGIDVPGVTGVMPFRSLGKIKFLQNLGRGTRLLGEDRSRLYDGEIRPQDWKNYIKPFCWLILPVVNVDAIDFTRRYRDYILALRSDYDFNTSENVIIDNIVAPAETEPTEDVMGAIGKKMFIGKGLVEGIFHSIEDQEKSIAFMDSIFGFNKSTPQEQIDLLKLIYAKDNE